MVHSSSKPKRQRSEKKGRQYEIIGACYLFLKGYWLISRRTKTPYGEIDLIFKKGKKIIFCEVKYRRNKESLSTALPYNQQKRIIKAAIFWLASRQYMGAECRIDVLLFSSFRFPQHLKNAILLNDQDQQDGL